MTLVKNKEDFLMLFALFLIPLDSVNIIFNSTYRPISVIFLMLYYITIFTKRIIFRIILFRKYELIFLLFIIISSSFSLILGVFKYGELASFLDFLITIVLGFISFSSFYHYFNKYKSNLIDFLIKIIKFISILPLSIGLIQVAGILGIINYNLSRKITSLFAYRTYPSRVQMTSGEPAMAGRFLITFFFVLMLKKRKKKHEKFLLLIIFLEIFFTFSMYTYISFALIYILYYLVNLKHYKKLLNFILLLFILLITVMILFNMSENINNYMFNRIKAIRNIVFDNNLINSINTIVRTDGSIYARTIMPLSGFIIGLKNPVIGVGGGYFYYEYLKVVDEYFPWARNFPLFDVYGKDPKNLYSKIASENGLIFLLIFFFLLYRLYKKIKKSEYKNIKNKYLELLFINMIILNLNFGSWAYVLFWFLLAFFIVLSEKNMEVK